MQRINFDREWEFRRGFADSLGMLGEDTKVIVNLPHDGMISTPVSKDAPAMHDSGYFCADICNYNKYVFVPAEWENESIGLKFDGVMMHANIEINGCKVGEHHYGYSPFYLDITNYVTVGENNRITININTGVQPSCRWYTGSGLFRSVELCHSPKVHIKNDGIYLYTKEISDNIAFIEAQIDVCNDTMQNRLAEVTLRLVDEKSGEEAVCTSRTIQVNPATEETAVLAFTVNNPKLWNLDTPNLYRAEVSVKDIGVYKTHLVQSETATVDADSVLFGIRTITVDAVRGLRINGETVKLKGGCVHHDNGLLGAVSLYETEARKVRKLKEVGFNAIRTAHNPPSAALVEACDREGFYIFDEAFDAWGMAKRPGDFSTYFKYCGETELASFVRRDRVHPSVIMWSIGNEIPERGGLNNGYTLATKLVNIIKSLDRSRPVSNGICSLWAGLDDYMAKGQSSAQNAENNESRFSWDKLTEPYTNGLDVVGYNYMEGLYENSHKRFPDRVILGSENFPKEIGFRWPFVESLPYVIGDFTWTAWDYIGEAGIGKSIFADPDDPLVKKGSWFVMPQFTSHYPWRLAFDADIDITGYILPQGAYRSVVWGSKKTHLYAQNPANYGKVEVISMWGFKNVEKCWNYAGFENKPIELTVFSNADEVALFVNGKEVERKPVNYEYPLPYSVCFTTNYEVGTVEAVSYKNGEEISRDSLSTTKAPAKLILTPEKTVMCADGHDAAYVRIEIADEDGRPVPDAVLKIKASVEGAGYLAGFGTGNPVTDENYTESETVTYYGSALAIIRSGYEEGNYVLKVECPELGVTGECSFSTTAE